MDYEKMFNDIIRKFDSNKEDCDSCETCDCQLEDDGYMEIEEDEMILPEATTVLSENEGMTARGSDGLLYTYEDGLLVINEDASRDMLPMYAPSITEEFVFTLFKIEQCEHCLNAEWTAISGNDIMDIMASGGTYNDIRVITATGTPVNMSNSEIEMLTIREIQDCNWEMLIEY